MKRLPLVYHWDSLNLPRRLALRLSSRLATRIPEPSSDIDTGPPGRAFDFSATMRALCEDIVHRCPTLFHVDLSRILFSMTRARNGRGHGLQARVTPLRFQGGALAAMHRRTAYQVQRMTFHGREILYLITFCLPRYLNRDFEDKLVTIFHELYHISPAFDGDLRRHEGRYNAHSASQKKYDAHMATLVRQYLKDGADPSRLAFLRLSFGQLCRRHGSIVGLHLPRPKLIPIHVTPPPPRVRDLPSPRDMPG
jgi:predicted metallopeptidase